MDGYTLDETTRTAHKGGIRMDGKMECPICKKRALFVGVHDDEGNYHGLVGCEYENDPWSGLSYALHLEGWGDCPLCTDGAYSAMGGMLFDTSEEAISALTLPNDPMTLEFDVADTTTGKYPDWERITIEEPWANRLVDCDMDGIAIREDGSLILLDEYGNCVSCPPYRFEIRRPPEGES